jgi:hypothetical protein
MSQTETIQSVIAAQDASNRKLKLRIFIIISVGVHVGFCLCWGAPEYIRWSAQNKIKLEEEAQKVAIKEAIKASVEINEKTKDKRDVEEVKATVVEDLQNKVFDNIVEGDFLNDAQKAELWNAVMEDIDPELTDFAKELYDTDATMAELNEKEDKLAGEMILAMERELKERTKKQFVNDYIATIKDTIAPKLADNYKKAIEKNVGVPLQREGSKIVKDETTMVERERNELKGSLDNAIKQAEKAAKDLADARDRISKAEAGTGSMVKDARDRESTSVKGEDPNIDQANSHIKSAIEGLKGVADKLNGNAKDKVAGVASNEGDSAVKATEEVKIAAGTGQGAATSKEAGEAADAAKKLGDSIAKVKGAIDAGPGDAKSKADAKAELDKAKKSADAAVAGLKGVGDRANRAKGGSDQAGKTSDGQLAGVVKNESRVIAGAEAALKDAEAKMKKAGEKASAFGEDLKGKIDGAASKEGKDAQAKTGEAGKAAKDGKVSDLKDATAAASDAAKRLADAAGAARKDVDSAAFDAAGLARAVLKGMADNEISSAMDNSFREGFDKTALPRLTGKLTETFEKGMASSGIVDDDAVAKVEAEIKKILGDKVPGMTGAGDASTGSLEKT